MGQTTESHTTGLSQVSSHCLCFARKLECYNSPNISCKVQRVSCLQVANKAYEDGSSAPRCVLVMAVCTQQAAGSWVMGPLWDKAEGQLLHLGPRESLH